MKLKQLLNRDNKFSCFGFGFSVTMASKEFVVRNRVVQFYSKNIDQGKTFTVQHFSAEGVSRRTIYNILKAQRVERKQGSGKKPVIMTSANVNKLKRAFDNKDGISQRETAEKMNCSQPYICKTLKRLNIHCRKKKKSPEYTEEQISTVKSQCRWMLRNYGSKSFILDDESYFPLSKPQMPGNNNYYTTNSEMCSPEVIFKFKKKI